MAGLYADIPGTRFALDQDGSVLKYRNFSTSSAWTDVSGSISETQKVNTANYVEVAYPDTVYAQMALAFPEARNITGLYVHFGVIDGRGDVRNFTWEYSTDTTDGTDGTWTIFTYSSPLFSSHDQIGDSSKPYYRSDIASVSLTNVKGLRARWNGQGYSSNTRMFVIHVYGSRPIAGVNRLAFWNSSTDQVLGAAFLDFGDISQGSSVTRQFRIKNLSGSLTANTIAITISDLLPEYTGTGIQLSTDNITFLSSISIGNLAPGTISAVLYIRRAVPANETATQRSARLLANAASWT